MRYDPYENYNNKRQGNRATLQDLKCEQDRALLRWWKNRDMLAAGAIPNPFLISRNVASGQHVSKYDELYAILSRYSPTGNIYYRIVEQVVVVFPQVPGLREIYYAEISRNVSRRGKR